MPGLRVDPHLFPQGLNGGHMMYPTSGVSHGLRVAFGSPAVKAATTGTAVLNLTAGKITLDGNIIEVPAITGLEVISGIDLTVAGPVTFDLYLNPTRRLIASPTPPGSPTTGMRYMRVLDSMEGDKVVENFYEYNGSAWVAFNPVMSPPISESQMGLVFNSVIPTVTAANFSIVPEGDIYHRSGLGAQMASYGAAIARQSASIRIATISYASSVGSVVSSYSKQDMVNL